MLSPEVIKRVKDNPDYQEVFEWMGEVIETLQSDDHLLELSNDRAGEEVKSNIKARKKLEEFLSPFMTFREKPEQTIEQVRAAKKRAGL